MIHSFSEIVSFQLLAFRFVAKGFVHNIEEATWKKKIGCCEWPGISFEFGMDILKRNILVCVKPMLKTYRFYPLETEKANGKGRYRQNTK